LTGYSTYSRVSSDPRSLAAELLRIPLDIYEVVIRGTRDVLLRVLQLAIELLTHACC
jgi:hypothetical protein